jgi:hypothetical protein
MNLRASLAATVVGGIIINGFECLFHGILLKHAWTRAFAALGKAPTGWTAFIPSNFILAFIGALFYVRVRRTGRPFWNSVAVTAGAVWLVFWVIPTMALLPLNLFPPWLVIAFGVIDSDRAAPRASRPHIERAPPAPAGAPGFASLLGRSQPP